MLRTAGSGSRSAVLSAGIASVASSSASAFAAAMRVGGAGSASAAMIAWTGRLCPGAGERVDGGGLVADAVRTDLLLEPSDGRLIAGGREVRVEAGRCVLVGEQLLQLALRLLVAGLGQCGERGGSDAWFLAAGELSQHAERDGLQQERILVLARRYPGVVGIERGEPAARPRPVPRRAATARRDSPGRCAGSAGPGRWPAPAAGCRAPSIRVRAGLRPRRPSAGAPLAGRRSGGHGSDEQ